jgi:hypothetical protein
MNNDEPSLEVSTFSSFPNLLIIPNKTFYSQGDLFNVECEEIT